MNINNNNTGSLDCLMALSAYGACFDQADDKGNTPIHYAAKNGHAMCCKFLSQRGFYMQINHKSKRSVFVYFLKYIILYILLLKVF